jgi:hypothetical protein
MVWETVPGCETAPSFARSQEIAGIAGAGLSLGTHSDLLLSFGRVLPVRHHSESNAGGTAAEFSVWYGLWQN